MRKRYTGEQRAELIDLVTAGHATVAAAAARLGVGASTAYEWMKQVAATKGRRSDEGIPSRRRPRGGPATFARLVPADYLSRPITVRVAGAEIDVGRGFDGDLLRAVIDALQGGAA